MHWPKTCAGWRQTGMYANWEWDEYLHRDKTPRSVWHGSFEGMHLETVYRHKDADPPRLHELPIPVIERILGHCDVVALRSLRLVLRKWAYSEHTLCIFKTVTIVPHLYYLRRFMLTFDAIADDWQALSAGRAITNLVIEVGWAGWILSSASTHNDDEPPLIWPGHGGGLFVEWNHPQRLDGLTTLYTEQSPLLPSLQHFTTVQIFQVLRNLRRVIINYHLEPTPGQCASNSCRTPDVDDLLIRPSLAPRCLRRLHFKDSEDYYLGSGMPSRGSHHRLLAPIFWTTLSVLTLHTPSKLRTLSLRHFDPDHLLATGASHLTYCFGHLLQKLGEFDLHLCKSPGVTYANRSQTSQLGRSAAHMIMSASNVSALRITGDDCHADHGDDIYSKHCSGILEDLWRLCPKHAMMEITSKFDTIKRLTLANIVCTPEELFHLVTLECPELRSLALINCMLGQVGKFARSGPLDRYYRTREPYLEAPRPAAQYSWIQTLLELRRKLTLSYIEFGGCFSNSGYQHWHLAASTTSPNPVQMDVAQELGPVQDFSKMTLKEKVITWFLSKDMSEDECPLQQLEIPHAGEESFSDGGLETKICDSTWFRPDPSGMSSTDGFCWWHECTSEETSRTETHDHEEAGEDIDFSDAESFQLITAPNPPAGFRDSRPKKENNKGKAGKKQK